MDEVRSHTPQAVECAHRTVEPRLELIVGMDSAEHLDGAILVAPLRTVHRPEVDDKCHSFLGLIRSGTSSGVIEGGMLQDIEDVVICKDAIPHVPFRPASIRSKYVHDVLLHDFPLAMLWMACFRSYLYSWRCLSHHRRFGFRLLLPRWPWNRIHFAGAARGPAFPHAEVGGT